MGKDPSFVAILIVTILLFGVVIYGAVWLKNYLNKNDNEQAQEIKPEPEEGSIDSLMTPQKDNVKQGGMIFKAAGTIAIILLLVYIIYQIAERKRTKYY